MHVPAASTTKLSKNIRDSIVLSDERSPSKVGGSLVDGAERSRIQFGFAVLWLMMLFRWGSQDSANLDQFYRRAGQGYVGTSFYNHLHDTDLINPELKQFAANHHVYTSCQAVILSPKHQRNKLLLDPSESKPNYVRLKTTLQRIKYDFITNPTNVCTYSQNNDETETSPLFWYRHETWLNHLIRHPESALPNYII